MGAGGGGFIGANGNSNSIQHPLSTIYHPPSTTTHHTLPLPKQRFACAALILSASRVGRVQWTRTIHPELLESTPSQLSPGPTGSGPSTPRPLRPCPMVLTVWEGQIPPSLGGPARLRCLDSVGVPRFPSFAVPGCRRTEQLTQALPLPLSSAVPHAWAHPYSTDSVPRGLFAAAYYCCSRGSPFPLFSGGFRHHVPTHPTPTATPVTHVHLHTHSPT